MYKLSIIGDNKLSNADREKISESIHRYIAPHDIILYIFAKYPNDQIPSDANKIHNAFKQLKDKYPDHFQEFIFSLGDNYPFSKELERVIFDLQQSGIMGCMNPSFNIYSFDNISKEVVIAELNKKLSIKLQRKLTKISKDLYTMIQ